MSTCTRGTNRSELEAIPHVLVDLARCNRVPVFGSLWGSPRESLLECSRGQFFALSCTAVLRFRGSGSALGHLNSSFFFNATTRLAGHRSASQTRHTLPSLGRVQTRVVLQFTAVYRTPRARSPRLGNSSLRELPLHSSQVIITYSNGYSYWRELPGTPVIWKAAASPVCMRHGHACWLDGCAGAWV